MIEANAMRDKFNRIFLVVMSEHKAYQQKYQLFIGELSELVVQVLSKHAKQRVK